MGHMLFAAVASGPGPRTSRRAALPISLAAHAMAVGALLALPLLAGSAPPPVVTRVAQDPVVLVLPAPPAPAPAAVVRPPVPRVRASAPPRAATAPATVAARPTIAVPVQTPSQVTEDAPGAACIGCALILSPPGAGNGGGGAPGGGEGGGGTHTGPWRVGGRISTPVKLRQVDPEYPALARAAGVQGTVVVECIIGADGRVTDARVVSGRPLLNEAALAAVRRWVYRPTLLDGAPVAVQMTVTVEFHLR